VEVLKDLEIPSHPNLIQSFENGADAGIYKLNEDTALVFTADFFTPVVDDPFTFGQIAAANSLADVYVCGGTPLLALNIICFPEKGLSKEILKNILKGGLEKVKEAGALLVGGHSVDDKEPKYGLAVLGTVNPKEIITNSSAKEGEFLYLTKPIGTGIIVTALKGGLIGTDSSAYKKAIEVMTELHDKTLVLMKEFKVRCATDITGFGLLGHAIEVATASKKVLRIFASQVPVIPEARELANMGIIPEGDYKNLNFCKAVAKISKAVSEVELLLLCDAQTSGGILFSVSKEKAKALEERAVELGIYGIKRIGEVLPLSGGCPTIEVLP